MKKIVVTLTVCLVALFLVQQSAVAKNTEQKPNTQSKTGSELVKLVIDQPVFTFDSIPEGEHITHEFKLKNTGDTPVKITDVRPP